MASTASSSSSKPKAKTKGSWLTRTKAFQKLCGWAFSVCDSNKTGTINETELYAGFLLVHLNLAKYAGPAACYPPPRSVVDKLFQASDDDNSGGIDEQEFMSIMVILCSQITSRILAYYAILILLVPYIARMILMTLDIIGVDDSLLKVDQVFDAYAPTFMVWMVDLVPDTMWAELPNRIISLMLFFLVIPSLFNYIDETSRKRAEETVVYSGGKGEAAAESGTASSSEKKEE